MPRQSQEGARLAFERKAAEEWLDEDAGDADEVASALRSLRFVNRWFGGNRVHRLLLGQVARAHGLQGLAVLEVAAGRATALVAAGLALRRAGIAVQATLLDRRATHLPLSWPDALPPVRRIAGDALAIPLADKSVDVVSCCLFLHHLAPAQVRVFLREAVRVARVAVVINDLERTRLHYALSRLFALADPSRLSRHDGPVSVRQAYSAAELRGFLHEAGACVQVERRFLYRLAGVLWLRGDFVAGQQAAPPLPLPQDRQAT